jgi:hypothetical protein
MNQNYLIFKATYQSILFKLIKQKERVSHEITL